MRVMVKSSCEINFLAKFRPAKPPPTITTFILKDFNSYVKVPNPGNMLLMQLIRRPERYAAIQIRIPCKTQPKGSWHAPPCHFSYFRPVGKVFTQLKKVLLMM